MLASNTACSCDLCGGWSSGATGAAYQNRLRSQATAAAGLQPTLPGVSSISGSDIPPQPSHEKTAADPASGCSCVISARGPPSATTTP